MLLQFEQVVGLPKARQGLADRCFVRFDTAVCQLGQFFRVPFTFQDGLDDGLAAFAGNVGQNYRQLEVHQDQALLHPVGTLRCPFNEPLPVTGVGTYPSVKESG